MEPRRPSEPTSSETRGARDRSRSPHRPNSQRRDASSDYRRRGDSSDQRSPSETRRRREEIGAMISKFEAESAAEDARRQALSSDERLEEDGDELRQKIESDPEMLVALEISASHRARCRANDDCVYFQANAPRGNTIATDFRICVHGVENIDWFGRTKHYYHVICFVFMMGHLTDLLPDKFKLDGASGRWGLMVEKWFEHSGRIDIEKITKFLDDFDDFEARQSQYSKWWWTHAENCKDNEAECGCPPRPDRPTKPELGDCTKEDEDVVSLLDVLEHRHAMNRVSDWWISDVRGRQGDSGISDTLGEKTH